MQRQFALLPQFAALSGNMAASCACVASSWRPSVAPGKLCQRRRRQVAARSAAQVECSPAERELLAAVESLGYPASIFPGDEQVRAMIDSSIERLEQGSPIPSPLQQPERGGQPSNAILGDWKLVYASSGTYVTRTAAAQALVAASRLPGTGVADIQQGLYLPEDAGSGATGSRLRTSNAACFGLGPFGEWEVCISGSWDIQDGSLARVSFDGFTLQLVGLLGLLKLPSMAKVTIPIQNSRSAEFYTTYLSQGVRVARGKSRNIFLFTRLP